MKSSCEFRILGVKDGTRALGKEVFQIVTHGFGFGIGNEPEGGDVIYRESWRARKAMVLRGDCP